MDGQSLHEPAWAKINLGLKVVGRRPDGYHELRSVVQTVSLADRLFLTPAGADGFSCDAPDLPVGPTNLVVRAREAFRARWPGARRPVQLQLATAIPV
ncbi:MAG: 4-(cytidine 5'-diphospho)-2-C-methyl-D-erythritol kinase, partial [Candidatus Latescibacterota bacterium]